MKEDDLPPFPRTAALALFIFFGMVVLGPGALRIVETYTWIPQRSLEWLVASAFLIVGIGLALSPRACIHIFKWPQPQGPISVVVVRVVGIFLIIASALFAKLEILHW
jgi:hypothetical protein